MCRIDDADGWTCLTSTWRTARKEHRCYECDRTIAPGERYRYVTGIGDFGFDVFKQCPHCTAAAQWLVVACSGYLFGGVLEELVEHRDEEPDLRSKMLDDLIAGIERDWNDGTDPIPDEDAIAASIPREAWSGYYVRMQQMVAEGSGQMALT